MQPAIRHAEQGSLATSWRSRPPTVGPLKETQSEDRAIGPSPASLRVARGGCRLAPGDPGNESARNLLLLASVPDDQARPRRHDPPGLGHAPRDHRDILEHEAQISPY